MNALLMVLMVCESEGAELVLKSNILEIIQKWIVYD